MIDLRSDTATRPTDGMRAAIAAAEVGDEQRREDPSVNLLQERAAALLGHEAALFVPTATMANQIALKLHSRPGDVLVAEKHAHVVIYEYGGAAAHAGLMIEAIAGVDGRFGVAELDGRDGAEHEGRRPACYACSHVRTRTTRPAGAAGRSTSSRPSRPRRGSAGSRRTSTAPASSTRPSPPAFLPRGSGASSTR